VADAAAGRPHRDVFMAGFELPTAAGFQDWLEQERARLGGLYLRSLWRLAEAAEADGRVRTAPSRGSAACSTRTRSTSARIGG
jgi:DNA-binding SARP family transcriptional activator